MTEGARISLERSSSELGLKKRGTGGERVRAVRRGRIAGSIGKKDRHSKVCTSKGPRDRRVRLSATTAIQFYDVQDRLGYDRPSKAVDWLMEKAKTAIDALAELPTASPQQREQSLQLHNPQLCNPQDLNPNPIYCSGLFHIADSNLGAVSHTQYPYLSIHGFQDPILGHHHSNVPSIYQTINSASSPLAFGAASTHWPHSHPPEMRESQKMTDWNSDSDYGIQGLVFDSLPFPVQEPVHRQNQLFSEREPLQSTDSALISTPMNPPVSTIGRFGFISAHIQSEDVEQSPV